MAGSPPKRCASQTGMIATTVSAAATTLMTGAWFGPEQVSEDPDRQRLHRRARGERRHHDLVEGQRERQDGARDQRAAHHRERHVSEGLPRRRAEVGRRVLEVGAQSAQPGLGVVEDDDNTERRMSDDDGRQAERDPSAEVNVAFSAIPVTMPGSVIGSTTRKLTVCLPKKSYRWTANAAIVPSTSAITVAPRPTTAELASDCPHPLAVRRRPPTIAR